MRVSKYVIAAGLILASQPVVAADHILDFSTCMQNFIAYAKQSRPSVASFTVLIGGVCKTEELALVDTPLMGTFLDDPGIKKMNAESRAHSEQYVAGERQIELEHYVKWYAMTGR